MKYYQVTYKVFMGSIAAFITLPFSVSEDIQADKAYFKTTGQKMVHVMVDSIKEIGKENETNS